MLGIDEQRCSRKQVEVRFDAAAGRARAVLAGVNPSFVRPPHAAQWETMEREREYELVDGCVIKPLLIGPEVLVELQSLEPAVKRAKGPRPACQYGAQCFRMHNPEHAAAYTHPDVNELNRARATQELVVPPGRVELQLAPAATAAAVPPQGAAGGHFAELLWPYCQRPEEFPMEVLHFTATVVAIRDKFPKARFHALVMPRLRISSFAELVPAHVPLLREMEAAGARLAAQSGLRCRLGFHMVPSMRQLHMHVISHDLDSSALKNKKHWNSFTTAFFVPAAALIAQLEDDGRVWFDAVAGEEMLKRDMHCHRCGRPLKTMPQLKAHIATCNGQAE